MYKRVKLNFVEGSFEKGFSVLATLSDDRNKELAMVQGKLPSNPELMPLYRLWKRLYRSLTTGRLEVLPGEVTHVSVQECRDKAELLAQNLNHWLDSPDFQPMRLALADDINRDDFLQFILQSDSAELQSLPWQLCQMMERYPNSEVCFSPVQFKQAPEVRQISHIKVLAVFGGDEGINLNLDQEYLKSLKHATLKVLKKPKREEFLAALRQQKWDMLFFAGHSFSEDDKKNGFIKLNDSEYLSLAELPNTLKVAIDNGLQLAIFNSCDGIGLARDMAKLNLPRVVVMREPVPDRVAQAFLKELLAQFSQGKPLSLAVRTARNLLNDDNVIKQEFPWASWLPALFQHPSTPDLRLHHRSPPPWVLGVGTIAAAIAALFLINFQTCWIERFCPPIPKQNPVVIGILTDPDRYKDLVSYLNKRWRGRVGIVLDTEKNIPYAEAKNRIITHKWDVAFTLSPVISITAQDNRYTYVARMFASKPPYYKSGLFVRSDSSIHSVADLTPQNTIAMGDYNSASSFYAPSYMLYGKTLRVDMKHRGPEILKLVRTGKVDIGAGAIGDTVNLDDKSIRIIAKSVDIPGSGVYVSPNLRKEDRQIIAQALLEVPLDARTEEKANYAVEPELDYTQLKSYIHKAGEIVACNDFNKGLVHFACTKEKPVEADVVGFQTLSMGDYSFTLKAKDKKTYFLVIQASILNQVPNASTPFAINGKHIEVRDVSSKKLPGGILELRVDNPNQIVLK
jgi:ABC transporter, phosphonate, periplasmic substrate-binding protein/CHAT domain